MEAFEIKLTNSNKTAVVDTKYKNLVSMYEWHEYLGFAVAKVVMFDSIEPVWKKLHHVINMMQDNKPFIFKDGNFLNCISGNISVTDSHSYTMRKNRIDSSTSYKGVSPYTNNRFWSRIVYKGNRISLGIFENQEIAARAYDEAAVLLFGDNIILNYIVDCDKVMNDTLINNIYDKKNAIDKLIDTVISSPLEHIAL